MMMMMMHQVAAFPASTEVMAGFKAISLLTHTQEKCIII